MSGRIGRVWDAVAGTAAESGVPRADAGLGWEFVAVSPQRMGPRPRRRSPGSFLADTATPAACDHGAAAGLQPWSTHRTSAGTVGYARCRCGAWLVLLDGQPLAATQPRPRQRTATPPAPGERPHGWWKKWTWRRRRRADSFEACTGEPVTTRTTRPALLSNPPEED
jgi:hypothetical protein